MMKWYNASKTGKAVASAHIRHNGATREVEIAYLNGIVYWKPTNTREFLGPVEKTFTVSKAGSFRIVCVGAGGQAVTIGNNGGCAGGGSGSCSVTTRTIAKGDTVTVLINSSKSQVSINGTAVCSGNVGGNATASGTTAHAGSGAAVGVGTSTYPGKNGTVGTYDAGLDEYWCSGGGYANASYPHGCGKWAGWHEGGFSWEIGPRDSSALGYVLIERT